MFRPSVEHVWDIERVEADIRFRAVKGFRDDVTDAMNAAARRAALHAMEHAPHDRGNLRAAIHFTPAVYRPGGRGGGGTWEAVVGVDDTIAPHAKWLLEGTGLYGPHGQEIRANKDRFTATSLFRTVKGDQYVRREGEDRNTRRNSGVFGYMTFQKLGEPRRFRKSVKGQKKQEDWWFDALDVARQILDERIHTRRS